VLVDREHSACVVGFVAAVDFAASLNADTVAAEPITLGRDEELRRCCARLPLTGSAGAPAILSGPSPRLTRSVKVQARDV
jgi:hypothetical protein